MWEPLSQGFSLVWAGKRKTHEIVKDPGSKVIPSKFRSFKRRKRIFGY